MKLEKLLNEVKKEYTGWIHDPDQVISDPETGELPKFQSEFEMFAPAKVIGDFGLEPTLKKSKLRRFGQRGLMLIHLICMIDALTGWTLDTHGIDVYAMQQDKLLNKIVSAMKSPEAKHEKTATNAIEKLERGESAKIGEFRIELADTETVTEGLMSFLFDAAKKAVKWAKRKFRGELKIGPFIIEKA